MAKWHVEEFQFCGRTFYRAVKTLGDMNVTSGGWWETRGEAQSLADKLNEKEAKK